MPTVVGLTEPHLSIYTPVPTELESQCPICWTPIAADSTYCYSCQRTYRGASEPIGLVIPISFYKTPDQLWHTLRKYKDPRGINAEEQKTLERLVAATFGRFLLQHQGCIQQEAGSEWDVITTVPSTSGRAPPYPLDRALSLLANSHWRSEQILAPGPGAIARNSPADDGYTAMVDPGATRILLVDDTFTSGSHIQSAASALGLAGAQVVAAVVIGRAINTEWSLTPPEWWRNQRSRPFSFETCCLE